MVRSSFFAFLLLITAVASAFGQANTCINASGGPCGSALTGTAITQTGYNPNISGAIFVVPASSLQSGNAVTLSYDIKTTSLSTSTTSIMLDARGGTTTTGFVSLVDFTESDSFLLAFWAQPGGLNFNTSAYCRANTVHVCARVSWINDGNWHHVCQVAGPLPTNSFIMIDAILRDFNDGSGAVNNTLGFTPSTTSWSIGNVGINNYNLRELQSKQAALLPSDCATLYQYHLQGLRPTTGPLAPSTWSISLPMDNCNGSGCADNSGNGNNAIYDSTPPTVAITAPTAGQTGISGSFTVTATCTDTVGVSAVYFFVDNVEIGSDTSSPYTATWTTTNFVDGAHSVSAICVNTGNTAKLSATVTASTSNSISAKTVYLDPTSGTDCPTNSGLSTGSPCSTFAGVMSIINSNPLHGGDSILLQHGTTLDLATLTASTVLTLNGPSSTLGAQNTFAGQTITIGTYGGGTCLPLAGTTTGCASVVLNTNGTNTIWEAMENIVNVPNVTIQDQQLFGQQSNAYHCPDPNDGTDCSMGIRYVVAGGYSNGNLNQALITNNTVKGFSGRIYVSAVTDPAFSSFGTNCGVTVSDNYLDDTDDTSQTGAGVEFQVMDCFPSASHAVSATASSNYVNNTGGHTGGSDGSGIVFLGGGHNIVDTNNVTLNMGFNITGCGPYGNWWDVIGSSAPASVFNPVEGNESGLSQGAAQPCDHGAFDLDNATSNFKVFWNYAHETFGPSINMLTGSSSGFTSGNNTQAYNILEDGTAQTTNQNAGLITIGANPGYSHVFNNNIWNGYNGQTISPNTQSTLIAGIDMINCPTAQSVVANNIVVSNSVSFVASAEFYYGGFNINCPSTLTFNANDWFPIGTNTGSLLWRSVNSFTTNYTSLSAWNTAVSAVDISKNPNFAGSGGGAMQCYTALSGIPVQPGTIMCPSAYELNNNTNALIGAGYNYTSLVSTAPGTDYFTNTVPNGVGTGYNVGADGGHH